MVKRGGTLVVARKDGPAGFDPVMPESKDHMAELSMYEALVRNDTDLKEGKSEITPGLAEAWERVDPKTIVFKLRKGVKFHDGSDFNAEVAKWNLERMWKDPKSAGARLAATFASVDVVDPYTLRISYKAPSAHQLLDLTNSTGGVGSAAPSMVSKAQMENVGEAAFATSKPSGTGPMKVVEWKSDDFITLMKFDNYWRKGADGKPLAYLDGMKNRAIPDTAVQLVEMKAGTVHVSGGRSLTPDDLKTIGTSPDLRTILISWSPQRYYIGFNQEKEPFGKNLKLRQAAQYALDRETFAKVLAPGSGSLSYWLGWIPAWIGYDETLPRYEFNPDKAKALVKEAGYEPLA